MRLSCFILTFSLLFFSCEETKVISDNVSSNEDINLSKIPSKRSPIDSLMQIHGIEILNAYYQVGSNDLRQKINKALNINQVIDFRDILFFEWNNHKENLIKNLIEEDLSNYSKGVRKELNVKVFNWLRISRLVNANIFQIDVESYLEILYKVPEMQRIIDHHIDPTIGQSTSSLASAQIAEIEVEIWNYLLEQKTTERMRILNAIVEAYLELND